MYDFSGMVVSEELNFLHLASPKVRVSRKLWKLHDPFGPSFRIHTVSLLQHSINHE